MLLLVLAGTPDMCAHLLTFTSFLMILVTFPLSLLYSVKIVLVMNCLIAA